MRDIGFVEVVFYALSGFVLLIACETTENRGAESAPDSGTAAVEELAEALRNPLKDAYFGDLHIHSSWSLDAFAFGVRVGPEDAYHYARGGEIDHISGKRIRMHGPPLDFIALTEHANYMH